MSAMQKIKVERRGKEMGGCFRLNVKEGLSTGAPLD